jgi:hypothetical protein
MRGGVLPAAIATLAIACGTSFEPPTYTSYPTSATLCEVDVASATGATGTGAADTVTPNIACSSPGGDSGLSCWPYMATTSTPPAGAPAPEVQAYWCCGDKPTCDAHYAQLCSDPLVPLAGCH